MSCFNELCQFFKHQNFPTWFLGNLFYPKVPLQTAPPPPVLWSFLCPCELEGVSIDEKPNGKTRLVTSMLPNKFGSCHLVVSLFCPQTLGGNTAWPGLSLDNSKLLGKKFSSLDFQIGYWLLTKWNFLGATIIDWTKLAKCSLDKMLSIYNYLQVSNHHTTQSRSKLV
jgi:hypothetical protein